MPVPERGNVAWHWYFDALAKIVAASADESDEFGSLKALCRTATADLTATGVAVSLMSEHGSEGVVAASDPHIRTVDELQFSTGEGPCIEAFAERRPVLTPDLAAGAAARWPGFSSAALSAGVAAVFAFPLHLGAVGFGVLDVYYDRAGTLSEQNLERAITYARIGTEVLVDKGLSFVDSGDDDSRALTALDYRTEIYQAQGIVVVDLGVDAAEALARMRAYAFAHDRPLIELAREIIGGFSLPSSPTD